MKENEKAAADPREVIEKLAAEDRNTDVDTQAIDARELALRAVRVLDEKKAKGLKLLHVTGQTVLADYFVICSGTSRTAINSLSGELEMKLAEDGIRPARTEGIGDGSWVLMDYHSVIVHIFSADARKFYNLEKLWGDAEEVSLDGIVSE